MSDHPHGGPVETSSGWNHVFVALAAEPRRRLLVALIDESETPLSLPGAAMAPETTVDPATVDLELRHHHLPLLESGGYINWQPEPLCVSRGPRFDEIRAVVDGVAANASAIPDRLCRDTQLFRQRSTQGQ
ncbi:hypothetical protein [Natronolimnobius baerhuensis]|uniref:Transcriptional regulator n=1 Tax=Natronolimnobius baerhuensis TaxID=253108 RepID=A0A202E9N2_9EURY|nr:hypothetical protein [Natronolimnobius baerhuensis]OVE84952.1 hypothetical protein B2G88_11370 [Natronolimnobius baerhuensis]